MPLIVSHPFEGTCPKIRAFDRGIPCSVCGEWHGGVKCLKCGFPKYEHDEPFSVRDMGYSSWSISRELREQITDALSGMRRARKLNQSHIEWHYRMLLLSLFEIHHAGLDTKGSWKGVIERNDYQLYLKASHQSA